MGTKPVFLQQHFAGAVDSPSDRLFVDDLGRSEEFQDLSVVLKGQGGPVQTEETSPNVRDGGPARLVDALGGDEEESQNGRVK